MRMIPTVVLAAIVVVGAGGTALGVTTVSRSGNTVTITGGDEVNFVRQRDDYPDRQNRAGYGIPQR